MTVTLYSLECHLANVSEEAFVFIYIYNENKVRLFPDLISKDKLQTNNQHLAAKMKQQSLIYPFAQLALVLIIQQSERNHAAGQHPTDHNQTFVFSLLILNLYRSNLPIWLFSFLASLYL